MKQEWVKKDGFFFVLCLLLGMLAEESFFRGQVGISFIIFIIAFYTVFFWRYRAISLSHQRLGYLVLCCVWLLAASYMLNDNALFRVLNILIIPGLVIFHLVLVTSPNQIKWNQPAFVTFILLRIFAAIKYIFQFAAAVGTGVKQGAKEDKLVIWKKVLIGIVISIPVLFVVLTLLMSADSQFERLVGSVPNWFKVINAEEVIRFLIVVITTLCFFGFMQVLLQKPIKVFKNPEKSIAFQLDTIITITVLILINAVYVLFTVVQFKYFFGGSLQADYTYAEYARKGFFELLFVTLINFSITVAVLTLAFQAGKGMKRLIQVLLTVLILTSSIMLCSAFLRLSMYEEAYGFTFTRVLAHSFMIFLILIFAYTLVKIWMAKLSLLHFYFITSLLYYTAIAVMDLDKIVVEENIQRYETYGKIDVHYLNRLSYTGVLGLTELYKTDPHIPELASILQERKNEALTASYPWQSYNLKRGQVNKVLRELEVK
ncbi:DUF4153 domain-containing protein [Neobacillus dielmonensis]|uniref:DUF4153 domain-containing protein n=1 Tax=Neobacillus dielmonensis TaxID=1347369 RepID=UPI000693507B|nr:DUF4173 domain-containing protein [Neobacillus dielmonensis]